MCPQSVEHTQILTHHRERLHSAFPAWRFQSCCAVSCWGCWSSPPSLPRCPKPAGRCSYPASSARRQTSEPWCSAEERRERGEENLKIQNKSCRWTTFNSFKILKSNISLLNCGRTKEMSLNQSQLTRRLLWFYLADIFLLFEPVNTEFTGI